MTPTHTRLLLHYGYLSPCFLLNAGNAARFGGWASRTQQVASLNRRSILTRMRDWFYGKGRMLKRS